MARTILIILLVILITFPIYYLFLKSPPPLPEMDYDAWWGPEETRGKQDTSIKPFKVKFTDEMIKDLRARLKSHRAPAPPLEGVAFEYGFNSARLGAWLQYWRDEYPFAERENFFNQFPQFTTNIQGLNIHFIRVTPKVPAGVEVVPMLLLHGWPGSVREFYEAIPLLTAVSKDRDFAIEVIVPSLPGYGFSDGAVRPGMGTAEVAVIFRNLMKRLGFKKYYTQGGDWGAVITSNLITLFPDEVLGHHSNCAITFNPQVSILDAIGSLYPALIMDPALADRMYPLSTKYANFLEEFGYLHLQATKPDTVGIGLNDSPGGLLAYIVEKFVSWTRLENRNKANGGLNERWTKEKLIDNLMLYWAPQSMTTAMRLYSESFNVREMSLRLDEIPTPVPTWALQAKHELMYQPPFLLKYKFANLVRAQPIDDGGHFLAFELPEVFSADVLAAVTEFRRLAKNSVKSEL